MQKQYSLISERGIKEWWNGTNWTWSWICVLHDQQGSDAKMESLEVAVEPQNGQGHLWASVEVCLELPDVSLSHLSSAWKSILYWSSLGFLLLLFSTIQEAKEFVNPVLVGRSADQLKRTVVLKRGAVLVSAVWQLQDVSPGHPSECKVNVNSLGIHKSTKIQHCFAVVSLQLPVASCCSAKAFG